MIDRPSFPTAAAWNAVFGLSLITFPLLLLIGFATHPNLMSVAMVTETGDWIEEWRDEDWFHIGHLLVMLAVAPIIGATAGLVALLRGPGAWLGFAGGLLAIVGAVFLAIDKGALTFVLTAFRDLPDAEFSASEPAFAAIFHRAGWLALTWGYVTLPLGEAIVVGGLLRENVIPRWQAIAGIAGLLLLMNPDIEIISTVGALLMCFCFLPAGAGFLTGRLSAFRP